MAIKIIVDKETVRTQAELVELVAGALGAKCDGDIVKAMDEMPDTLDAKGWRMVKTVDGVEYTIKDIAIKRTLSAYKADVPAIIGLMKSLAFLVKGFTAKMKAIQNEMNNDLKINGMTAEEYIESKVKTVVKRKTETGYDDDED